MEYKCYSGVIRDGKHHDNMTALSCKIVVPWHWLCYAKLGVKCDPTADRWQSLGKGQVSTSIDNQRCKI